MHAECFIIIITVIEKILNHLINLNTFCFMYLMNMLEVNP